MTNEERKMILTAHADRLRATTTFEEYKAVHIAYVEFLIGQFDLEDQVQNHIINYVVGTEDGRD